MWCVMVVMMGARVMVLGRASVGTSVMQSGMNGFCLNCHDCYFGIHESMTVILTCYTCAYPSGGV